MPSGGSARNGHHGKKVSLNGRKTASLQLRAYGACAAAPGFRRGTGSSAVIYARKLTSTIRREYRRRRKAKPMILSRNALQNGNGAMRLDDLKGDTCLFCDEPMPDERRADQVFCSKRCLSRYHWSLESEAIREAKRGRTCVQCGGLISVDLQASAIYCGIPCQQVAAALRRLPAGRPCARCGEPVPVERLHATTCSEVCRRTHQARDRRGRTNRPTIPCVHCGQPFLQKKNSNSFCSRSCASQGRRALKPKA